MLEGELVRKILLVLKRHGGVWFKIHGNAYQEAGIPDIIGCYQGQFVAFEVKHGGRARVSKRQRWILERIRSAGGISTVVESPADALFALGIESQTETTSESRP